jgi:hypothetical protein
MRAVVAELRLLHQRMEDDLRVSGDSNVNCARACENLSPKDPGNRPCRRDHHPGESAPDGFEEMQIALKRRKADSSNDQVRFPLANPIDDVRQVELLNLSIQVPDLHAGVLKHAKCVQEHGTGQDVEAVLVPVAAPVHVGGDAETSLPVTSDIEMRRTRGLK